MPGTFYTLVATNVPGAFMAFRLATNASVRAAIWQCALYEADTITIADQMSLARTTGGTVTTVTPEKTDIDSGAASTTAANDSSVDPTISGQPLVSVGMRYSANITGNQRAWSAHPRWPIIVAVSAFLSDFGGPVGARSLLFSEPGACPVRTIRRRGRVRGYWHAQDHHQRTTNPTTSPRLNGGCEFTMLQAETWPESFVPPNMALLFAVAAAPIFEDVDFFMPSSPVPEPSVSVYG